MINPKMQSDMDQAMAAMVEMFPPAWRGLYLGLVREGFTEEQAMRLLMAFITKRAE